MLPEHGLDRKPATSRTTSTSTRVVTLDSDGAVGGDVLVRLVCLVSSMEKHPRTGLPQTQFAGMPAAGSFTRLLQFGMRHNVPVHNVATLKVFAGPTTPSPASAPSAGTACSPVETESYETNPPTLLDFLRREHRWCQSTVQYWFLLEEPRPAVRQSLPGVPDPRLVSRPGLWCFVDDGRIAKACWMDMTPSESSSGLAATTDG